MSADLSNARLYGSCDLSGLETVRKQASAIELETRGFYEKAAARTQDASIRQLLMTWRMRNGTMRNERTRSRKRS